MKIEAGIRYSGGLWNKVLLLLLGVSLVLSSGASATPTDLFLKFDGIAGESTDSRYRDWSEISSVNWGVSASSGGVVGGGGAGKVVFQDLTWSQVMDKSVTGLFSAIAKGQHIKDARVDFIKPGVNPLVYFKMEFREVFLTNLDVIGTSSSKATIDGAFSYDFLKMTYTPQKADGSAGPSVSAEFDLKTNKGSLGSLAYLFALGTSGPTAVVPIPASLLLLGSGLLGLVGLRRFRKD
jgi:type VI secretion system secreted protein Hcp